MPQVTVSLTLPAASPVVGFMPLLRSGDLLFNAIVLRYHMLSGTAKLQSIYDIQGNVSQGLNIFGPNPQQVNARIFGSTESERALLLRHTLVGVYGRAMAPSVLDTWIERMSTLRGPKLYYMLGAHSFKVSEIRSLALRSCPECVEAGNRKNGFATWRVLHQIPGLGRCPIHGSTLVDELHPISPGQMPRLWSLRFPTGRGEACPQTLLPMSEGYSSYLKSWSNLFAGDLPEVRADRWRTLVNGIVRRLGGVEAARQRLMVEVTRSWEASAVDLAQSLSLAGGASFISCELALLSEPKDVARRLIVLDAAVRLGVVDDSSLQAELQFTSIQVPSRVRVEGGAEVALRESAQVRGLPLALADILIEGGTMCAASRRAGIASTSVVLFVRSLPLTLLLRLKAARVWEAQSWLSNELVRRQQLNGGELSADPQRGGTRGGSQHRHRARAQTRHSHAVEN